MFNRHLFFPLITFEEASDNGGGSADGEGGEGEGGGEGSGSQTGKDLETIDDYQAALKDARSDAAKQRTKRKEIESRVSKLEELESKFDKFKSIFGEDEEIDPEELKSKTENLQSELQQERVKNAVTIQAMSEGLDPDLTIAYLQNKGQLKELDASDSDSVQEIVTKVADDKPALKVKEADTVGSGNDGNDEIENDKPLNPIDAYRQKQGLLNNSK